MCKKYCFVLFVLVYLIIPTEESVRHGFPPNSLHVNMESELNELRRPAIINLNNHNNINNNNNNNNNNNYNFNVERRKRDLQQSSSSSSSSTKSIPPSQSTTAKTTSTTAPGSSSSEMFNEHLKSSNISVKVNALNDSHAQLMVHWLGDGSDVMICLARDPPLTLLEDPKKALNISPSAVYFSYDYGDTFINKTHLFHVLVDGVEKNSTLDQFVTHPKFDVIIFTDSRNKAIFNVPDKGDDVKRYMVNFTPSDIAFYENDAKTFLVLDKEDPEHKLYYTIDAGATFSLLQTSVKSFSWNLGDGFPPHLYVERREPTNTSSVIFMNASDLLKSNIEKEFNLLIENVNDFHIKKDFMFVTRKVLNTTQLWISYKRGQFVKADFQTELDIKAMHIADVEGNRILVSAAHSDSITHLYVSEGNTDMTEIKFVPSLENIFTYIPQLTWLKTWIKQTTDEAFTDLYKVEGLRGIYIASKIDRSPSQRPGTIPEVSVGPEHLVSVISFDHGSSWRPITAPKVDDIGQPINCTKDCSLHLSQKFNQLYPVTRSVTIMSSKLAPGIIMASGVIGKSLKGHPGVFLSRNGGLTWRQVLRTYHFFNFGDHGGILVAVKYFKSKGETREILYSTDEGETWNSQEFHASDLKVYGLMTEPNTNTTIFTLFGSEAIQHRWLIVKIDLRNAFSHNCTADDYKYWAPSSQTGDSLMPCLLGMQQTFQRRAPHSNCFNGKSYERPVKMEVCQCNKWDFECDFGYSRINANAPCIFNKSMSHLVDPYKIPEKCIGFYYRSRGYRKIDGDVCVGGYEGQFLPQKLSCPLDELNTFLVVAQRDRISRINLTNGKRENVPITDLKNVIAIDFDMKHNCVFYADIMSDKIGRQCLNGNQTTEILVESELVSIEGMSYDWISELLFFVDGTRSKIEAVKTSHGDDARMRVTIIDSKYLVKPRGIVVHPLEGYLFWTEWSAQKPSLSRSNLDGSDIRMLFTKPDVVWPNGVTIDYFAQRVYWVDASKDYIASCDLNGKSFVKVLQDDSRLAHPFAVAVLKDLMFWDDWKMNSIYSADKDHGIMIKEVAQQMNNLMDLKIYSHSLQDGTNACSKQNTCSHICVGAPKNKYTCLCPEGMVKSASNGECLCPGGMPAYLNKTCPQIANTCGTGFFACENKLCVPALFRCDGENDCGDNSDENGCSASHPPCPPHMFTCKIDNKCIPEYFACDFDIDCDDSSDEEGCKFNECKFNEFRCKNGRCISQNWMCDGEDDCRDGSDESPCPVKNTTATVCKTDQFRCGLNGECMPSQWRCDNDYDCPDGSDETGCHTKECDMWEFNCGDGRCIYKTWKCDGEKDCANWADEENCTTTVPPTSSGNSFFPSVVCHEWMFKCGNNKCIPMWWKCDKVNDCGDGSDELGCSSNDNNSNGLSTRIPTTTTESSAEKDKCFVNQFQCNTGACISKPYVCDGIPDCSSGEDELNCPPDTKSRCGHGKFRCRSDHICLPLSKYCDKVVHCSDGSDEEDCDNISNKTSVEVKCGPAYFRCDHRCLPLMKLCDDKQDCYDGTDEEQCGTGKLHKVFQVTGLMVENRTLNATSFVLSWWLILPIGSSTKIEFLPSISLAGNNSWQNHTEWITDTKHRFTNLIPYTTYNVTVYVRSKHEQPAPPFIYTNVTTTEGVPSEPLNVNVTQLNGSRVQVSWDPPKDVYGELIAYTVYYRPQTVSTGPVQSIKIGAEEHSIVWESFFKGNTTYAFWVKAKNSKLESASSKMILLKFDDVSNIDSLKLLTVTNVESNSVSLKWQEVKGADGYTVQPFLMQPYPRIAPLKTEKSEIDIKNMVAGVEYVFRVSAYVKNYVGRPQSIKITLKGDSLPEVQRLSILHNSELVRLTWEQPKTNLKNLTYGVYYGTTLDELFEKPRIITQGLSVNLTDLLPCESYLISASIIGPIGPGPLGRSPLTLETSLNDKKPPRSLRADVNGKKRTMTITWQHNCPIAKSNPSYLITITDVILNKTSRSVVNSSSNRTLSHFFSNIPNGAVYNISVSTNLEGAEPAFVVAKAPEVEGPRQLKVWPEKNGTFVVYWKELNESTDYKYTYELVIFAGLWSSRTTENPELVNKLESKSAPILVNPEHLGGAEAAGKIFTIGIRAKTNQGYSSSVSETENIEIPPDAAWLSSAITSTTYAWLVIIPILLVITLAGVIVYLIQRHKRLQNSFSRFANSHYDTKTGATRIGDTFDDEDQVHQELPQFGDDEPLVIA